MEIPRETNLIICGVGGQGVILISQIVGNAAVRDGFSVAGSEIHGMAARGGAVSSHFRISERQVGPVIPIGQCDVLVAMEPAEALRNAFYLAPSSTVILNSEIVVPFTVSLGKSHYPESGRITEELQSCAQEVITLDAGQIALQAGSRIASNIVMVGALLGCGRLPVKVETAREEIRARFGEKAYQLNMAAFDSGMRALRSS